jgi:hypothetical protein
MGICPPKTNTNKNHVSAKLARRRRDAHQINSVCAGTMPQNSKHGAAVDGKANP